MAITNDWYFDWATPRPGPADRINYLGVTTPVDVMTHHSWEGWYATYDLPNIPERFPTLPHGVVLTSGEPIQFAPLNVATVHGHLGNYRGPGWEADGTNAKPLTSGQVDAFLRMHRDLYAKIGRKPTRWTGQGAPPSTPGVLWLAEHRQMALGGTACPSERYRPLWEAIAAQPPPAPPEDDMTDAQVRAIVEDFVGKTFVEYIEAYHRGEFSRRPVPVSFWKTDLEAMEARLMAAIAASRCGHTVIPGVSADGG